MKKKLAIKTRVNLLGVLDGQKGSHAKRQLINDAEKVLALSEKEIKDSEYFEALTPHGLTFKYNVKKDPMKKIQLCDVVLEVIVNYLTEQHKSEQLGKAEDELYVIFVLNK